MTSSGIIDSKIDGLVNVRQFLSDYPVMEFEISDYMLSSPYFNATTNHPLSTISLFPIDEDMKVSFHQACKIPTTRPFLLTIDTKYCENNFDMMSYQIRQYPDHTDLLLSCHIVMMTPTTYSMTLKSLQVRLTDVVVIFPLRDAVERVRARKNPGNGNVMWHPEKDTIEWILPTLHTNRQYSVNLEIHHSISHFQPTQIFTTCIGKFTIPNMLISNRMKIERVQLIKSPQAYKYRRSYHFKTIAEEYYIPLTFSRLIQE